MIKKFTKKSKRDYIDQAKNAFSMLSAILFISEPGSNRTFDGGKPSRGIINTIHTDGMSFY